MSVYLASRRHAHQACGSETQGGWFRQDIRRVSDKRTRIPYEVRHAPNPLLTPFLRSRNQLQFGQEQERTLEEALNLLSGTREEDISPMLRGRLTMMALMVARCAEGPVPSVSILSAYQLACQHISPFRDPRTVDLFLEVHVKGALLLREKEETSASALMLRTVAEGALTKAIEMCELLYGKHHDHSVHLQGLKKSRGRPRLPS